MNKPHRLFSALIFLLFTIDISAQTHSGVLSVDQIIKMGLDSSTSLRISTARLKIAEAKYNQALDAVLPNVRVSAGYTRLSDVDEPKFLFPGATEPVSLFPVFVNNYSAGVSVSETIFSGFRLKYARESQKLLQDAATSDFNNDRQNIVFALVSSYFNLYKLETSQKVVDDNLKQIQERVRETQLSQQNGLSTANDVLRWQLQQSNLELTKIDIQNNLDIANYNMNLLLGYDGNVIVDIDTNAVEKNNAVKSLEDYIGQSGKQRDDLKAAEIRSKASFDSYKIAKNSYLPRIAVQGDFLDARPNPRYIPPIDVFKTTWALGINFNWDLVNIYSNRHNVDEYQSLYDQSRENLDLLSDAVRIEVNQNYRSYGESLQKVSVNEKAVAQAEDNYRLMDSRFRNSLVILSDLLDANDILIQQKINLALAKADVQIAYYRLLKSTGNIN